MHTVELVLLDCDRLPLPDAGACLDPRERARAARLRAPHAARYRAAHCLLRHVLAGYLDRPAEELRIGRQCLHCGHSEHGKPVLADAALQFSLSHTAHLALVAVSRDQPVGVDVERVVPGVDWPAILGSAPADAAAGFAEWTAREAVGKATGHGILIAPEVAPAGSGDDGWRRARVPGQARTWWVHEVDVPTGFRAAVAVARTGVILRHMPAGTAVAAG